MMFMNMMDDILLPYLEHETINKLEKNCRQIADTAM